MTSQISNAFDESDFKAILSNSSYEGFGSFFSADVEDLIRLPDEVYTVPAFPKFTRLDVVLKATQDNNNRNTNDNNETSLALDDGAPLTVANYDAMMARVIAALPPPPPFGRAFREAFFDISNDFTFVNHGAFGGALKIGTFLKHHFERLMESQLLTYMDRLVLPWIAHSTRAVADTVLNCKPTDLVLVPNATYGLNAAIAGLITHGDVVVFLETEYLAVFKMLQERCEQLLAASTRSGGTLAPAALKELPMDGLLLDDAIMGDDAALTAHMARYLPSNTTVIVMDLITSTASLHLPVFTHIIPAIRRAIPSIRHIIVDGAHGPLQCDVNIGTLRSDQLPSVYVGNLHKWFSAPKSVGVMWVREDVQPEVRPIIVSHGAKNGFLSDFIWDGTRDHSPILALPTIIDFWYKYIGVEKVRSYCTTLKEKAVAMLVDAWGSVVKKVPRGAPFMTLVMLPPFFQQYSQFITAKYIQDMLHLRFKVEVPVKIIRGVLFLRVSFFVNNDMRDYEVLRDAVLSLQQDMLERLTAAQSVRERRRDSVHGDDDENDDAVSASSSAAALAPHIGEKRSRSPAGGVADGNGSDNANTPSSGASSAARASSAVVTKAKSVQQQHHDKSQIVRTHARNGDASEATGDDGELRLAPSPFSYPLSAINRYTPFKPAALDVPLQIGDLEPIIVTSTEPKPIAGVLANISNASATTNNALASGGSGSTVLNNSATEPAPAPPAGGVDPNCNGCGLGAIGAAPKKTRKF